MIVLEPGPLFSWLQVDRGMSPARSDVGVSIMLEDTGGRTWDMMLIERNFRVLPKWIARYMSLVPRSDLTGTPERLL